MSVERVLVVGAGIGGLAAATALAQRGLAVEVVERKPTFMHHGVGLGQPGNALRALDAVGVLDEVLEAGFEFERFRVYDYDRDLIVDHRFLLGGEGIPPFAALPRADLHRILLRAAGAAGASVTLGTTVSRLVDEGDAVAVELAGGRADRFDLVVGFDGLRSWTRRQLFGAAYEPEYTSFAAWRLIVDRPSDVTCMEFYQGIGSKTGVMPLTRETMYLFHIRPEPGNPRQDPSRLHEALRERLAGYGGVAGAVRDSLSPRSEVVYSPLEMLMVPRPWHRGRVVIAGDAAHTVPPHFTQGAGMAVEDGIVLAEELSGQGSLEEQLRSFAQRRFDRCNFVKDFAGKMLADEQSIVTMEQLEAARRNQFGDLDARLNEADRYMNGPVLAAR